MQTELLKVTGMTCGGCGRKVAAALKGVYGVSDVDVSLAAGEATVKFDERLTSPVQLKSAVLGAGYGVDATEPAQGHQGEGGCCGGGAHSPKPVASAAQGNQGKRGCCA